MLYDNEALFFDELVLLTHCFSNFSKEIQHTCVVIDVGLFFCR